MEMHLIFVYTLYWVTLLHLLVLIVFCSLFSIYVHTLMLIMLSASKGSLTSYFQSVCLLFLLSHLIALVQVSYLVPDLREKAFSLPHIKYDVNCRLFVDSLYRLRKILCLLDCGSYFFMNRCWNLSYLLRWSYGVFSFLVSVVNHIDLEY